MRKHAETFDANKGCSLAIVFYTNFAVFKIEIQGAIVKRYLHENVALQTPTFYMKMNHFDIVFHITRKE